MLVAMCKLANETLNLNLGTKNDELASTALTEKQIFHSLLKQADVFMHV